ncbi:MAG: L-threonylcarbamoyladenylate synthase [Opitutus sp.]
MTAKSNARIYRGTPRNIAHLAKVLLAGDLVAVPTETVYGLAANALDPTACRKIFKAKGRPTNDPLIVHLYSIAQLHAVAVPNPAALKLARAFWPGPLTIVLPKRDVLPDIVSSGLPSVAVRIPNHPLFRRLLKRSGLALAAPSANPFGYISPTTAAHVQAGLGRKIAHILDGGASSIGVESTIVDLRDPAKPRLLRPGAITRAQIEAVLGMPVLTVRRSSRDRAQISPGLLKRHYSPRTPSVLHDQISLKAVAESTEREAWIFMAKPTGLKRRTNVFWLDARGQLKGAAHRLFDVLRQVDARKFARINLERATGGGLADAINDRLERAAAR